MISRFLSLQLINFSINNSSYHLLHYIKDATSAPTLDILSRSINCREKEIIFRHRFIIANLVSNYNDTFERILIMS